MDATDGPIDNFLLFLDDQEGLSILCQRFRHEPAKRHELVYMVRGFLAEFASTFPNASRTPWHSSARQPKIVSFPQDVGPNRKRWPGSASPPIWSSPRSPAL